MNKKVFIAIGVVVIALVVAAILVKKSPNISPEESLKIGIATLLHGDFAIVGENIVKSAELAAKEINDKGGIGGRKVEFVIEDAGYTSKDGLSAVQKLVEVDKVHYLIAGMSSNGTLASAELLNKNHIVVLSPVTGGSNIDNAGDYIFRVANSDMLAGRDLARAMIEKNFLKAGIVYETTEYTSDIANSFSKEYEALGGQIVSTDNFQSNMKDYRTMILALQKASPDALLVLSQLGTNAAEFIKQSQQLGYTPPLFTDFTLVTNPDVAKIVENLKDVYYADPAYGSSKEANEFLAAYKQEYGIDSPIPFHALATYDSLMLLTSAIEKVGNNPEKVAEYLANRIKNYNGLMGTFTLDKEGNSDLGFVIKQVQ